jgi:hypothetical protein
VTIDQATYQKLCRAQELLSHTVPSGDIAQVLDRALELLVAKLEKRKFAATEKPRSRTRRASKNPRHIPAHVRRAVTERDGGQCTFVSEDGHRCATRRLLEFDHVEEVARGGVTTVDNIRLRCKAHNQYSAECTFGVGFMDQKRRARMERCINRGRCDDATPQDRGAEEQEALERDLAAGLKTLGYRPSEIREALAHCRTLNGASLEERMRAALALLRPRATTIRRPRAPLATSLERVDDPARIAAAG